MINALKKCKKQTMEKEIQDSIFSDDKSNLLLIGAGGTGKSFIIRNMLSIARQRDISAEATAATGVAAVNINGMTLHRFFGVGLCQGNLDELILKVRRNYDAVQRIIKTKILFIDEISMVGADFFDKLDLISKHYRKSTEPFGGIKLILSGDFLQLPPVKDNWIFFSKIWLALNLKFLILNKPKRYTDRDFYEMLMRAREGILIKQDILKINERVEAYNAYMNQKINNQDTVEPTILYSYRIDVDIINKTKLDKLNGEKRIYKAKDLIMPNNKKNLEKQDNSEYNGNIKQNVTDYQQELNYLAPEIIELKIGAQVMITRNLNVEQGICNGTRAVVIDLNDNHIKVKTRSDQTLTIEPVSFTFEDKYITINRFQLPVIIAYALTIHKSQGSTLDFCIVDLGPSIFAPGQAYVALSRVRDWNSLLIKKFFRNSVKADNKALQYNNSIEEAFLQDSL